MVVKSFQNLVGHVSHRRVDSVDCSSDFPRATAEVRIPQKKNELKQRVQRGEEAGTRKARGAMRGQRRSKTWRSVSSACQIGAHECPRTTGEKQEHLDAVVAFASAGQRMRMFRVLGILHVSVEYRAISQKNAVSSSTPSSRS